jgi:imidazolonepropionase-like amidohydrolase
MRHFLSAVLAAALAAQPATVIVLDGARLVDGTGRPPLENARIVIEGDRIVAAGAAGEVAAPPGAERIDLSGRTVLPGLVDVHFHIGNAPPNPALALLQLANGVTSFRDPGQWDEANASLRAQMEADGLRGPRIHIAGPHIDGPGPTPYPRDAVVARDADEAREFAERAIAQGATAIKIYFRLPLGSARAVIDVCRARGVISTAHLEQLEAGQLFEHGLDGIEHITSLGPSLLPQVERERYRQAVLADNSARNEGRYEVFAGLDFDSPEARALWAIIGKRRPFVDATLAVFERRPGKPDPKAAPETVAVRAAGFRKMLEATRRAHDAGARIVVGGHSNVPFAARGEAVWREMELLAEAGLTPMQVIQAATATGAAFLQRDRDLGTVEAGKFADLIVVTGNPARQVSDIRTIERVMAGGRWVDRAKYGSDARSAELQLRDDGRATRSGWARRGR